MKLKDILLKIDNGVATVTFNRPDIRNAITLKMREEIGTIFEDLRDNKRVRAVVITGAGNAFCAGGDVNTMAIKRNALEKRDYMIRYPIRAMDAITNLEKPIIAMMRGPALGVGVSIAAACDFRIASAGAKFGMLFANVGMACDWGGSYLIPRLIGIAKAKELMMMKKIITAAEAEHIGLINRVTSDEDLEVTVYKLAQELANGPTKAFGLIKTLVQSGVESNLRAAMDREASALAVLSQTADHKEGVAAFLEKRPPVFHGK